MAENNTKKVLLVSTSCDNVGGKETGLWLEELAGPYFVFTSNNYTVHLSSIKGGKPPVDQGSLQGDFYTESAKKFNAAGSEEAKLLSETQVFADCKPEDYDAVFFCGGHGTCGDFPAQGANVMKWWNQNKVVGAVCHGPTCLFEAKLDDGTPLVAGKKVTSFNNSEETYIQSAKSFLESAEWPETKLKSLGAKYSSAADWTSHVVVDGRLITGQNPGSSEECAKAVVTALSA